jgi:predicted exporter
MKSLLPLAETQYTYLGFPPEYTELFHHEFAASQQFCLPENAPASMGITNLWIGRAGGHYYSCIIPVNIADGEIYKSIASEYNFVHFINKAQDISRDLNIITRTIMVFFLAAYAVVSILIFIVYRWRDGLKICAIPLFLILSALAVLTLKRIPLGFFSVAGLLMVFGLGLDYIIYMTGRKGEARDETSITHLAVTLSFLTTILSFGALVFSSFTPVHIFGLTVSAGLCAAFISAMLLTGKKS